MFHWAIPSAILRRGSPSVALLLGRVQHTKMQLIAADDYAQRYSLRSHTLQTNHKSEQTRC